MQENYCCASLILAAAADRVHSTEAVGRGDQVRARKPHSHHQRQ